MTRHEAEAEAIRRWGGSGTVWHHSYGKPKDWDYCRVGIAIGDCRDDWVAYGKGLTWEAAFSDASKKGK